MIFFYIFQPLYSQILKTGMYILYIHCPGQQRKPFKYADKYFPVSLVSFVSLKLLYVFLGCHNVHQWCMGKWKAKKKKIVV